MADIIATENLYVYSNGKALTKSEVLNLLLYNVQTTLRIKDNDEFGVDKGFKVNTLVCKLNNRLSGLSDNQLVPLKNITFISHSWRTNAFNSGYSNASNSTSESRILTNATPGFYSKTSDNSVYTYNFGDLGPNAMSLEYNDSLFTARLKRSSTSCEFDLYVTPKSINNTGAVRSLGFVDVIVHDVLMDNNTKYVGDVVFRWEVKQNN